MLPVVRTPSGENGVTGWLSTFQDVKSPKERRSLSTLALVLPRAVACTDMSSLVGVALIITNVFLGRCGLGYLLVFFGGCGLSYSNRPVPSTFISLNSCSEKKRYFDV